ncbi:MAG TPA: HEAT repeat domain-containing protein [Thermoanaerobaculia bacterium]|nr:HEAT repeat domain-containing protein [Thermoanaerobaculia bacterium]HQP85219.1 HEAT repeat domain-containing protein [Thermoanaerobaculia bacterium]
MRRHLVTALCLMLLAPAALAQKAPKDVSELVARLASSSGSERASAARSIGYQKDAALPAVPRLLELLAGDRDNEVRVSAAEALGNIGPKCAKPAVPALMKAAKEDKWPKVRSASLSALGEMREAAKPAIPLLRESLRDPDGFIAQAARNALFRVQPDAKDEVVAIEDATRPKQKGSLFDDLSQLQVVLPGRAPEVYELAIYPGFALATTACAEAGSGRCQLKYEGGAVTGPNDGSEDDCEKKIALAKVDFSVVPGLVKQAPALLGAPGGAVTVVQLSAGVFCKSYGWIVHVKDGGMVQFKLNGKVDKVTKF